MASKRTLCSGANCGQMLNNLHLKNLYHNSKNKTLSSSPFLPALQMTKEVRDNFDGLTYDEDETMAFTFVDRNDPRGFIKVEGDINKQSFLKLYGTMVKKPKYQRWVRATDEEKEKFPNIKGHWEKISE